MKIAWIAFIPFAVLCSGVLGAGCDRPEEPPPPCPPPPDGGGRCSCPGASVTSFASESDACPVSFTCSQDGTWMKTGASCGANTGD